MDVTLLPFKITYILKQRRYIIIYHVINIYKFEFDFIQSQNYYSYFCLYINIRILYHISIHLLNILLAKYKNKKTSSPKTNRLSSGSLGGQEANDNSWHNHSTQDPPNTETQLVIVTGDMLISLIILSSLPSCIVHDNNGDSSSSHPQKKKKKKHNTIMGTVRNHGVVISR